MGGAAHGAIQLKNRAKSKPAGSHGMRQPFNAGTKRDSGFDTRRTGMLRNRDMKNLWLALALFVGSGSTLFGNGGAWQAGIPATGNASASKNDRHTDVTIENEMLKIDLHPEYADVNVRYRMHNTGPKVQQDFFFPVERWGKIQTADEDRESDDINHYQITVDGKELKSTNVAGPKEKSSETKEETSEANQESSETKTKKPAKRLKTAAKRKKKTAMRKKAATQRKKTDETTSGSFWQENVSTIKSWKKSVIPFERNQTRDVTIHYKAGYAENDESVSDDLHISNATFAYSLSPAATWKGPIGKGKIEINILHPEPEDVSIQKPKDRFKKISDTHYEWDFENLKPTMADDIRIVAHSKYDSYPTGYSEEDATKRRAPYVHSGQLNTFSITPITMRRLVRLSQPKANTITRSITSKDARTERFNRHGPKAPKDDGIGESITLNVKRPLPLYGILIQPGY